MTMTKRGGSLITHLSDLISIRILSCAITALSCSIPISFLRLEASNHVAGLILRPLHCLRAGLAEAVLSALSHLIFSSFVLYSWSWNLIRFRIRLKDTRLGWLGGVGVRALGTPYSTPQLDCEVRRSAARRSTAVFCPAQI